MQRRAITALTFLILAVIAASLSALLPIDATASHISWRPPSEISAETALRLAATTPESLLLTSDCAAVRKAVEPSTSPAGLFWTDQGDFGPSGLQLMANRSAIWIARDGAALTGSQLTIPPGACEVTLEYQHNDQRATVALNRAGQPQVEASGDFSRAIIGDPQKQRRGLTVTGLHLHPAMATSTHVDITTQIATVSVPPWRFALSLLGLVFAATVTLILAYRAPKDGDLEQPTTSDQVLAGQGRARLFTWSDATVGFLLAIGLVIAAPNYDDGWFLTIVRHFKELGYFSNFYNLQGSAQPQGFWWMWLEHFWLTPLGTPPFLLRLPAALLLIWTWWLIRRRLLDPMGLTSRAGRICAVAIFSAGAMTFLFTLRPEPMIALLLAIQLTLILRSATRPGIGVVGLQGLIAALALGTHQAGLVVVAASLASLPIATKWYQGQQAVGKGRAGALHLAMVGVAATCFALLLATLGSNIAFWSRATDTFASDTEYNQLTNELGRFDQIFTSLQTGAGRIFFLGAIAILTVGFLTRSHRDNWTTNCVGRAACLAPLGLLVTVSKVPNHLGALTPALAVLSAILIDQMRERTPANILRLVTVALAWAGVGYVATNPLYTGARNTDLLAEADDLSNQLPFSWMPASSMLLWGLIVAVPVTIALWWAPSKRKLAVAGSAVTVCVAFMCVWLSMSPLLREATNPESWIGQQVSSVTGGSCGLGGKKGLALPTVVTPQPVVDAARSPTPIRVSSTSDPVNQAMLLPSNLPVYAADPGAQGPISTPWFSVPGGHELVIWTSGNVLGMSQVVVNTKTTAGRSTSTTLSRTGWLGGWQNLTVTPSPGTASIQVEWNNSSGPTAITAPSTVDRSETLVDASGSGYTWVGPDVYLQAPCLKPIPVGNGVIPAFDWSLGNPTWNGATLTRQLSEYACPGQAVSRWNRCATRVNNTPTEGLTITTKNLRV